MDQFDPNAKRNDSIRILVNPHEKAEIYKLHEEINKILRQHGPNIAQSKLEILIVLGRNLDVFFAERKAAMKLPEISDPAMLLRVFAGQPAPVRGPRARGPRKNPPKPGVKWGAPKKVKVKP